LFIVNFVDASTDDPPTPYLDDEDAAFSSLDAESDDEGVATDPAEAADSPATVPCWACQTLQAVGTLVGDPTDRRRTCSQFQGTPQVLNATEPLLPVIAQTVGWAKLDPIHWMAIMVGEFTHCHLR
jgi:hypothetical protein